VSSNFKKRTDGNHAEIRDFLRGHLAELGLTMVIDTHALGDGFPDLVLVLDNGRVLLVELKTKPIPQRMIDEVEFMIKLVSPAYRMAKDEQALIAAIHELREV
jgi:ABC-type uncharacterized transport system ATPase subunit